MQDLNTETRRETLAEKSQSPQPSSDPNMMLLQAMQQMQLAHQQAQQANQQALERQEERMQQAMQAMTERLGGGRAAGAAEANKSRAKGRLPDKLERDVDYASFLQWEKSWKLYEISDNLASLPDNQQTAILFSFFTKELLSDLEYRFKVNITTEQKA